MSYTAWVVGIVVLVMVVAAPRYGADSRESNRARFGDRERRASVRHTVGGDLRAVLRWVHRLRSEPDVRPVEGLRASTPTGRG